MQQGLERWDKASQCKATSGANGKVKSGKAS